MQIDTLENLNEDFSYGVGPEHRIGIEEIKKLKNHYYYPESRQSTEVKFYTLLFNWKHEVEYTSSTTEIVLNPFYQRIIGMGPIAVPLLLKELERETDHLFWALQSITGENPVPQESWGNLFEMAQYWLRWGKQKGYI